MRKVVLPIIAAAIVVFAATPPVLGWLYEPMITAQIERLDEYPFFTVELESYERGWFGSVAVVELGIKPAYLAELAGLPGAEPIDPDALSRKLAVRADIAHGPVSVGDGVHVGWAAATLRPAPDDALATDLAQLLGMPYLFELRTQTGFGGAARFELDVPAIDYASEFSELVSSGFEGRGRIAGGRIVSDAALDSLSYTVGPVVTSLTGFTMSGDNELVSRYVWLGRVDAAAERFTVASGLQAQAPLLDATGLRMGSRIDQDPDGRLVDGSISYAAAAVRAGADVEITDAKLTVAVDNVDAAAITDYYDTMQRLAAAGQADPDVMLAQLGPIVERLLHAGPSVTIEPFAFSMNDEPFDARIHLNVVTDALPPAGSIDLADPALWIQCLSGSVDASVSKPLAEVMAIQAMRAQLGANADIPPEQVASMAEAQASFVLLTLTSQGILEDDGDVYRTHVLYEGGRLTVNDSPVPLGL